MALSRCARALARARPIARAAARIAPSRFCCRAGAWPRVRQVDHNAELTTLNAPMLVQVNSYYPQVRAIALAWLIAPSAARIAPGLPCR